MTVFSLLPCQIHEQVLLKHAKTCDVHEVMKVLDVAVLGTNRYLIRRIQDIISKKNRKRTLLGMTLECYRDDLFPIVQCLSGQSKILVGDLQVFVDSSNMFALNKVFGLDLFDDLGAHDGDDFIIVLEDSITNNDLKVITYMKDNYKHFYVNVCHLEYAVPTGNVQLIEFVLNHLQEEVVTQEDFDDWKIELPMMTASRKGYTHLLQWMHDDDRINFIDEDEGPIVLDVASSNGHVSVLKWWLQHMSYYFYPLTKEMIQLFYEDDHCDEVRNFWKSLL